MFYQLFCFNKAKNVIECISLDYNVDHKNLDFLHVFQSTTSIPYAHHYIATRGLYTFYPLFEVQKRFLRGFFLKILALCLVSIQERFLIKSELWWRVYTILNLLNKC